MIKQRVKETFNKISSRFDQLRKLPWPDLVDFINESGFISNNELRVVLDLGCGNGRHGRYLKDKKKEDKSFTVIGVDISFNFLKIAQKTDNQIHYINADANFLPFKSNIFNKVLFIAAIHHIPNYKNRKKCLLEIKRILTNTGILLLSVWRLWQKRFYRYFLNELSIQEYKKWNGEWGDIFVPWRDQNKRIIAERFYHLFSIDEFKHLINNSSFKITHSKIGGTRKEKGTIFATTISI